MDISGDKVMQSVASDKLQEFSRVNKCFCNFARLITIKVRVFKNAIALAHTSLSSFPLEL